MQIQRILKGITGLDDRGARETLTSTGILSNWWRGQGKITPEETLAQLTEDNLRRHLNGYDQPDAGGRAFGEVTPFISTTAGAVLRDAGGRRNVLFDAKYVATHFATDGFRRDGWVFSGYVFTLGCKAIAQEGFAEEVRELHLYSGFLPYQPEGEIVAKVHIPVVQLEEAWEVSARFDPARPAATSWPVEGEPITNAAYVPPEELVNLRGLL